jgi:heme/copper-type cytochrome/quinol oxidase subunit 2
MKLLTKTFLIAIIITLGFLVILAQTNMEKAKEDKESKRIAEMKKLDFLVGTWKGKGWIMTQNGRQTFTAEESLERKLAGQIVVVDGLGKSIDEKTGKEKIVHQAYGVFSYDATADKIKFRWYKADSGEEDETTIEVSGNKFVWGFDVPQNGVKVKFTENINEKGNWIEIGEVTRDGGKTWFKFFEMELSKVSE